MLTPSKIYAVKTRHPRSAKIRKKSIPATSAITRSPLPTQTTIPPTQLPEGLYVTPPNPSSMKIVKRCLLVYLTTFLALFVSHLLWNNPAKEYLTDWPFYVLPLLVIVAGLILGWFGFMIIQHLRWVKSFYLLGLNLCGIADLVFVLIVHGQSLYRAWYLTSHPSARYNFDDHGGLKGSDMANGSTSFTRLFPIPTSSIFEATFSQTSPPPDQAMTRPGSYTTFTSFIPTRSQPALQKSN